MADPCAPVDFVPAACEAAAVANCIISRECKLEELSAGVVVDPDNLMESNFAEVAEIQLMINEADLLIWAAVVESFILAGCPVPTKPLDPEVPDFSDCIEEAADMGPEIEDRLGYLKDTFNITFDSEGVPTRIRS